MSKNKIHPRHKPFFDLFKWILNKLKAMRNKITILLVLFCCFFSFRPSFGQNSNNERYIIANTKLYAKANYKANVITELKENTWVKIDTLKKRKGRFTFIILKQWNKPDLQGYVVSSLLGKKDNFISKDSKKEKSNKDTSKGPSNRTIYTGPKGGKFYYNSNGKKTYIKKGN